MRVSLLKLLMCEKSNFKANRSGFEISRNLMDCSGVRTAALLPPYSGADSFKARAKMSSNGNNR